MKRGELVRILPEWSSYGESLSIVWPNSRHLAPRVQRFVEIAVELLTHPAHETLGREVE